MSWEKILFIVLPILVSALVGRFVYKHQAKEVAAAKDVADKAQALANDEKEKRETIARGHQALLNRVTDLEKQGTADAQTLALLKQEMLPMAEAMKRKMIEILTHPGETFEIPDRLLAQVKEIGAPMPDELVDILKERETSEHVHVTEQERLAAEALPIIVRLAELEARQASSAEITSIQLVSSTAKSSETKKAEEGD